MWQMNAKLSVDDLIGVSSAGIREAPIRGESFCKVAELKYVGKKPVHFISLTHEGKRDESRTVESH